MTAAGAGRRLVAGRSLAQPRASLGPQHYRILHLLREYPGGLLRVEIEAALSLADDTGRRQMRQLLGREFVQVDGRYHWKITELGQQAYAGSTAPPAISEIDAAAELLRGRVVVAINRCLTGRLPRSALRLQFPGQRPELEKVLGALVADGTIETWEKQTTFEIFDSMRVESPTTRRLYREPGQHIRGGDAR